MQNWTKGLTTIAVMEPHAAHAAFTHKWFYPLLTSTMALAPSSAIGDSEMRSKLQPPPNDAMRRLLALPGTLRGIALSNLDVDLVFLSSTKISETLEYVANPPTKLQNILMN